MRPGTDPCTPARAADLVADEGAAYARALLARIKAGQSSPDDLAGVLAFVKSGACWNGACAVLYAELQRAAREADR